MYKECLISLSVSYHKIGDTVKSCSKEGAISNEILKRPSQHPRLKGILHRPELASLLPRAAIMEATEASSGGESGADMIQSNIRNCRVITVEIFHSVHVKLNTTVLIKLALIRFNSGLNECANL